MFATPKVYQNDPWTTNSYRVKESVVRSPWSVVSGKSKIKNYGLLTTDYGLLRSTLHPEREAQLEAE